MKTTAHAIVLSLLLAGSAVAQHKADDHGAHHAGPAVAASAAPAEMTDGEVRKIDREAGKLTLRHGEIRNLDMPGMTMVFQVKELALLDKVKVGDKVKFRAEKSDGRYLVTDILPAE